MAEYIERNAAIKAVKENDCEGYATWAIKAVPAADVQPVRHGRWLYDEGDVVCSECDGIVPGEIEYIRYKFCPWCGAKIGGEDT